MDLDKIKSLIINIDLDSWYFYIPEIIDKYLKWKINLQPPFQRKYKWNKAQKSNLIESILLWIPTPSIFVFEDKDLNWEVIDWQQRITTILEFYKKISISWSNSLKSWLSSTEILGDEFLWKTINDFDKSLAPYFSKTKLHIFLIWKDSDEEIKYKLFERLNKSWTTLTPQEIRNSYLIGYSWEIYNLINTCSQIESFRNIAMITQSKIDNSNDKELILRSLALFKLKDRLDKYKSISSFLNENLWLLIKEYENKVIEIKNIFIDIINRLNDSMWKDTFKSINKKTFANPIFDTVMYWALVNYDLFKNMSNEDIKNDINSLKENTEYQNQISSGPSGKDKLKTAINFWENLFK